MSGGTKIAIATSRIALALAVVTTGLLVARTASAISPALEKELQSAEYVYISSTRKDGSLGEAAEIWFFYHQGAVYVGTKQTTWRVRRIVAGRPDAKIWVGKRDGTSFAATGELIDDDALEALLMKTFAAKYPEGWKRYAENFRKGFEDKSRVIVKYTAKAD